MLPLIFFFKYLKNEKRYDFALLWLLVITYFERFCQISRDNFDWLTGYGNFVCNFFFFETTFFAKYFKYTLCWSGKYDFFSSEITF